MATDSAILGKCFCGAIDCPRCGDGLKLYWCADCETSHDEDGCPNAGLKRDMSLTLDGRRLDDFKPYLYPCAGCGTEMRGFRDSAGRPDVECRDCKQGMCWPCCQKAQAARG